MSKQIARLLNNNAKKGGNWEAERVYQISVLNFHLPKDDKCEMSWYTMKNENGHNLADHLNVIFIDLLEIKKLIGTPVDKLTGLQKWGLYLSYADDESKTDYINEIVHSEEGIMEADIIVGRMSEEDSNWFRQNSIDIAIRDYNSERQAWKNKGLTEGREQGLAEGRAEGREEKTIEDARNFYANGASIELIANSLKMSEEKVKEIVKEVK